MLTVDIDTGGTMTDALVSDGETRHAFKVDTTPGDYTVSFLNCLGEAAVQLGYPDVASFLGRVSLVRWSSTITTNVLGERRGSKVGLMVAKGHEEDLYGDGRSPVMGELIADSAVIGLSDDPTPVEVLGGVKQLLEAGVRRLCVCLEGSFPDNAVERKVKWIVEDQYPDHIIGSVPVLLGSDMAPLRHDQTRCHYSVMNAYTHTTLASSLFKAEDLLREEYDWTGPLLIGHTNGGVARIGKTKAVDTIESGPVFGTFAGANLAGLYGLRDVLCFDVGGTTTKASVVRDGRPVFQRGGDLLDIPVKSTMAMLRSAVIGGGSVSRPEGRSVALGPESMGAAPGPACYGLGGDEATLTDALLLLGYLDPESFLGGRRTLEVARSAAAIEARIAEALDVSVEAAALMVRDEAVDRMAELLAGVLSESGLVAAETSLFAFGGNGPMFAAFVAERLGIRRAQVFDLGPVMGAFGSAISDVVHTYERGVETECTRDGIHSVASTILELRREAERDLRGEGFDAAAAGFEWELHVGTDESSGESVRVRCQESDAAVILDTLADAVVARAFEGVSLLSVRLSSRFAVGSHATRPIRRESRQGSPVLRTARFNGKEASPTPVHRWEHLGTGDKIAGPALINGDTLTCPIPPGWTASVDDFGNLALERAG